MKTVKIILAVAVLLLGTCVVYIFAQDKKGNDKTEQVVFSVNMHCENCEQKVKKNIPYEKGVKDLTTNLEKQLVTIRYQTDKTDRAKLKKAIEKLGYTCREIPGDSGNK